MKSNISLDKIRTYIESINGLKTAIDTKPCWTSNATKILEYSWSAAKDFGHDHISPDHIILSLLQHDQGLALNVLQKFDIDVPALILALAEYLRLKRSVDVRE